MKLCQATLHTYKLRLISNRIRSGAIVELVDDAGHKTFGDIAPLPERNRETLDEAVQQFQAKKNDLLRTEWHVETCLEVLKNFDLLPSLYFGVESALLNLLQAVQGSVPASALLMGSEAEILEQAHRREFEGFKSAKLKVGKLSFDAAARLIHQLKSHFRLRVDVNQAWSTRDSLRFFSQFDVNDFDYVEDPFANPLDLAQFTHPLAVEESFRRQLSLDQLEQLPNLKALIYKPTSHGGLGGYLSLFSWAKERNVELVLSSNFESDLGLACIAQLACRIPGSPNIPAIGIGTYHHQAEYVLKSPLLFSKGCVTCPDQCRSICSTQILNI